MQVDYSKITQCDFLLFFCFRLCPSQLKTTFDSNFRPLHALQVRKLQKSSLYQILVLPTVTLGWTKTLSFLCLSNFSTITVGHKPTSWVSKIFKQIYTPFLAYLKVVTISIVRPLHHSLLSLCSLLPLGSMAAWWSRMSVEREWQLDRWLSRRLMSISTRPDNSDSLTMNFSMSKQGPHSAIHSGNTLIESDEIGKHLSRTSKHKHKYSVTQLDCSFESCLGANVTMAHIILMHDVKSQSACKIWKGHQKSQCNYLAVKLCSNEQNKKDICKHTGYPIHNSTACICLWLVHYMVCIQLLSIGFVL